MPSEYYDEFAAAMRAFGQAAKSCDESLRRFADAATYVSDEWPDIVLEDILDAEFIEEDD